MYEQPMSAPVDPIDQEYYSANKILASISDLSWDEHMEHAHVRIDKENNKRMTNGAIEV